MLTPGSLWSRVDAVIERAMRSGHIEPIPTHRRTVVDGRATFQIRVIDTLQRKLRAREQQPSHFNPFLPYDPELFVADVTSEHVCLLNKFNVVDRHLLIVTRQFEPQEQRLLLADFRALWHCMFAGKALAFYNSGPVAGASQPHKHLQLVPLSGDFDVSLEPLYELDTAASGQLFHSPHLPFRHWLASLATERMQNIDDASAESLRLYNQVLLQGSGSPTPAPYNLLMTNHWMLFVPRRAECFETISLNALAYAGSLLVKDTTALKTLEAAGPMRALSECAEPRRTD